MDCISEFFCCFIVGKLMHLSKAFFVSSFNRAANADFISTFARCNLLSIKFRLTTDMMKIESIYWKDDSCDVRRGTWFTQVCLIVVNLIVALTGLTIHTLGLAANRVASR